MVAAALRNEGCGGFSSFNIYCDIWVPSGGQRGLDIARWDVTVNCTKDGYRLPIHVHSWATLTQLSKQKSIKLVAHSVREYEAM